MIYDWELELLECETSRFAAGIIRADFLCHSGPNY